MAISEHRRLVAIAREMDRSVFILGERYILITPLYPRKLYKIRDKQGVDLMQGDRCFIKNCFGGLIQPPH